MMNEKVILTDADGVLLDWIYAFDMWMKRHGYNITNPNAYSVAVRYETEDGKRLAKMFNESAWIRKIPPFKDAIKYVKKLHEEHGYVFHCISSLSDDDFSVIQCSSVTFISTLVPIRTML
jgi:FMN phosphatase YigB (HAD superfamily)